MDEYNFDNGQYPKEEKKKSKLPIVLFAIVFSLIGALVGGFAGGQMAVKMLAEEQAVENGNEIIEANSDGKKVVNLVENENIVTEVAENTLDSVVGITTKTIAQDFLLRPVEVNGTGSGIIVDNRGYILTNNHVVEGLATNNGQVADLAGEITVVLNDKTTLPAEVLWRDKGLDLAILKVEPESELKAVKLGDSDGVKIGEKAIAIGNPISLNYGGTVTVGYISGLNRSVNTTDSGLMENLIQTDASINSGNSGGPLLNIQGEVIGINTLKLVKGENMSFSIPINTAKPILEEVIETGTFKGVKLGVSIIDAVTYQSVLGVDLGVEEGVIVQEVIPNFPAEKAGLEVMDIIVGLNDKEIDSRNTLNKELYKYKDGDEVTIKVIRNREELELKLTLTSNDFEEDN